MNIVNRKADDAKEKLLQAYMKQLDKYKRSIESILKNKELRRMIKYDSCQNQYQ